MEHKSVQVSIDVISNLEWNDLSTVLVRVIVVSIEVMGSHVEKALVLIPKVLQK